MLTRLLYLPILAVLWVSSVAAQVDKLTIREYEEEYSFLDIHDGTTEEWDAEMAETTVLSNWDFAIQGKSPNLFEVRLAYTAVTSRMYVALEWQDNYYGPRDGVIDIRIDGDASGGEYRLASECCETEAEWKDRNNRHAQQYVAYFAPDGTPSLWHPGAAQWTLEPPYAEIGGVREVDGENAQMLLEFYVTVFDELLWDDPEASVRSQWPAASFTDFHSIGIDLVLPDYDAEGNEIAVYSLSGNFAATSADALVPGVLFTSRLLPECFTPECWSAVESRTWGALKAQRQSLTIENK